MAPKIVDITGQKFGKLTVVKLSNKKIGRTLYWNCLCECGKQVTRNAGSLRRYKNQSCGCVPKKERGSIKLCKHCNESFISQHCKHDYCSLKCNDSARKNKKCRICGKNYIFSEQGRKTLRYCSLECRIKDLFFVDKDGCWLGKRVSFRDGYSIPSIDGKSVYLHRYFWEKKFGPIPNDKMITRNCDNKNCVNPDHMKIIDKKDFHSIRPPTNLSLSVRAIDLIIRLYNEGYNAQEIQTIYRDKYKYRMKYKDNQ